MQKVHCECHQKYQGTKILNFQLTKLIWIKILQLIELWLSAGDLGFSWDLCESVVASERDLARGGKTNGL